MYDHENILLSVEFLYACVNGKCSNVKHGNSLFLIKFCFAIFFNSTILDCIKYTPTK